MTQYNPTEYQQWLLDQLKPETVALIKRSVELDIADTDQDWRWFHKYPAQILLNKLTTGKLIQQAAFRHFKDCEREDLYACEDSAKSIMAWFSFCPIPDGPLAGQPLTLDPPLIWMSVSLMAWRWKRDVYEEIQDGEQIRKVKIFSKGKSRFKESFNLVARKFSKTTWTAAIALYCIKKGAYRSRGYCFATTLTQSKEVWKAAASMIDLSPELASEFNYKGADGNAPIIRKPDTLGSFEARASNPDKQDGLNPVFACLDECHAITDYNQYGVVTSAFGAQEEYKFIIVTTAGTVLDGLCTKLLKTNKKVLDPTDPLEMDTIFIAIYQMDDEDLEGDNWKKETNWLKANPSTIYGRPNLQYLRTEFKKAQNDHEQKVNFLTKNCNIFVNSATKWLDIAEVRACADRMLDFEEFRNDPCILAFDRSVVHDISSLVALFKRGKKHYAFFWNLQTQNAINNSSDYLKAKYAEAQDSGSLTVIKHKATIETDDVIDLVKSVWDELPNCEFVAYDPYKMQEAATKLEKKGVEMIAVSQGTSNLSEPSKKFEGLISNKNLVYNGDGLFEFACECAVISLTRQGNVLVYKEDYKTEKIDPLISVLIGLAAERLDERDSKVITSESFNGF